MPAVAGRGKTAVESLRDLDPPYGQKWRSKETAATRKAPTTEKKPPVIQEPVMVVRGK
jgi:hypothetical protein